MENAIKSWSEIAQRIAGKPIFIFLDYDGTLTPIVDTPGQASLPASVRELLKNLNEATFHHVAIVSGRALSDIKGHVSLDGVIYVGNHGLEIEGDGISYTSQIMPRSKEIIEHVRDELKIRLSDIPGALLEDKGLTLGVHYRLVREADRARFNSIIGACTKSFVIRKKIKMREGKQVVEIWPSLDWNKGKAVLWILKKERLAQDFFEEQIVPLYIGDDKTDEDAFRVLKAKGLTIFVGEGKDSLAQYRLKDPHEVLLFLQKILKLKLINGR